MNGEVTPTRESVPVIHAAENVVRKDFRLLYEALGYPIDDLHFSLDKFNLEDPLTFGIFRGPSFSF